MAYFSLGMRSEGWVLIDTEEILKLQKFEEMWSTISIARGISNRGLGTGNIRIQIGSSDAVARSKDNPVVFDTQMVQQGAHNKTLSLCWGRWLIKVFETIDRAGFAVVRIIPNPDALEIGEVREEDDEFVPCCLDFEQLTAYYRLDINGRSEMRCFRRPRPGELSDGAELGYRERLVVELGLIEILDCVVLGNELPSSSGVIRSRIKRIHSSWVLYKAKLDATIQADRERLRPMLVTEERVETHDAVDGARPADDDVAMDNSPEMQKAHALTRRANGECLPTDGIYMSSTAARNRDAVNAAANQPNNIPATRAMPRQFALDSGRQYVNAPISEVPTELPLVRQAVVEETYMTFGIPPALVIGGDSTGRARLNTATASLETANMFRQAQQDRKIEGETYITIMFKKGHSRNIRQKYVDGKQKEIVSELETRKRKRVDPDTIQRELKNQQGVDGNGPLGYKTIDAQTRISVNIPMAVDLNVVSQLMREGILAYSGGAEMLSELCSIEPARFNQRQHLTSEAQIVYGVAQKESEGSASKSKSKSKKKKKKAKTS